MATSFGAPVICPALIGREPFLATFQHAIARVPGRDRCASPVMPASARHAWSGKRSRPRRRSTLVLRAHCFEADRALP